MTLVFLVLRSESGTDSNNCEGTANSAANNFLPGFRGDKFVSC
jgi:hypothetical protein